MKGDTITLTTKEQRRLIVLNHLAAGALTNAGAAEMLGMSVRQLQRLHAEYRKTGAAAVAHGNRGRRPAHTLDPELARRVVELATDKYAGFNQQHLTEMLNEREGVQLSRPTVHRILTRAGVRVPRHRRPSKHRQRRDRYAREGMLLQLDASRHDWLEGRGPKLSLVGAIDDATSHVPWALFREQEDAQGYFELMREVVVVAGIPMAVYSDRHSIFWQTQDKELTLEQQLEGRRQPTQFGRLLEELGVELILAHSPQAKGRVERLWGTLQDRLTSELRLAGASTREEAQKVLGPALARHNARFAVAASDPEPAWIPWPQDRQLDEFFCFKYRRVVGKDHTVTFGSHLLDIPLDPARSHARARVTVHEGFDGSLSVFREGTCLVRQLLTDPPAAYRVRRHSPSPDQAPVPRSPRIPQLAVSSKPDPAPRTTSNSPWKLAKANAFKNQEHASRAT
jgi:transposase